MQILNFMPLFKRVKHIKNKAPYPFVKIMFICFNNSGRITQFLNCLECVVYRSNMTCIFYDILKKKKNPDGFDFCLLHSLLLNCSFKKIKSTRYQYLLEFSRYVLVNMRLNLWMTFITNDQNSKVKSFNLKMNIVWTWWKFLFKMLQLSYRFPY